MTAVTTDPDPKDASDRVEAATIRLFTGVAGVLEEHNKNWQNMLGSIRGAWLRR